MSGRFLLFFVLLSSPLFGCTGGPSSEGAGTTDPEVAQQIQSQVNEFAAQAKKAPAQAKGQLDILLESLEGAAERSEEFAKVRDEAKELQSLYASNAGKSEIEAQLQALQDSADALVQSAKN